MYDHDNTQPYYNNNKYNSFDTICFWERNKSGAAKESGSGVPPPL